MTAGPDKMLMSLGVVSGTSFRALKTSPAAERPIITQRFVKE